MGSSSSKTHKENYPSSRQIETSYGPIEGRRLIFEGEKQCDAFQGIPYAAPPVGESRFSMPQPHEKWTEVRETKAFGPRGIQKDNILVPKVGTQSENNLSLNVYTPVWAPNNDSGFPIIVYIHGGGFVSDSAIKYGDLTICQHLVTKDVVVVTIQYRLGFLGFWTTGDDTIPDNLALHDMTFALKWIRENAAAFNGDANNITLMGQSAGGASVDLLSISPVSRDLFHKVIPMGGNANCPWAIHSRPLTACRNKSHDIGLIDELDTVAWIKKLRELPADKFASSLEINPDPKENTDLVIGPKYDKLFIPKPISQLRAESPVKPRLVGCAKSEGLIMCFFGLNTKQPLKTIQDELAAILPEKQFPLKAREYQQEAIDRLIDVGTDHSTEEWSRAICELKGDSFLNVGIQQNVLEVLEAKPETPIYVYSFDYFNPKAYGLIGMKLPFKDATHCTDISYVVGNHIVNSLEFNENDFKMIEITTRLWTNFAKTGNPNGESEEDSILLGSEKWLPATVENPQLNMSLDLLPRMHTEYKKGRPHFIAKVLKEVKHDPVL